MSRIHLYEDRLKFMKMIEDGYSIYYIHLHHGIDQYLLGWLWLKYKKEGPSALVFKKRACVDAAFRVRIVRDILENHIPLLKAAIRYDVSPQSLQKWLREARRGGYKTLQYKENRPSKAMGRPKKKKPEEMTELELLRYENERLRAENALLKKVRALVAERNAHLREIGQKPSKN